MTFGFTILVPWTTLSGKVVGYCFALQLGYVDMDSENNRPTSSVSLHNIERARYLLPILVGLPLQVDLSSNANKRMITINL